MFLGEEWVTCILIKYSYHLSLQILQVKLTLWNVWEFWLVPFTNFVSLSILLQLMISWQWSVLFSSLLGNFNRLVEMHILEKLCAACKTSLYQNSRFFCFIYSTTFWSTLVLTLLEISFTFHLKIKIIFEG